MKFATPLLSQYADIRHADWQPRACGITSLAMVLGYWDPEGHPAPQQLLEHEKAAEAYVPGIGWRHKGLVELARQYGYEGANFDWFAQSPEYALSCLRAYSDLQPVIVSMYKDYAKENGGGHLAVLAGIEGGTAYLNDPNTPGRDSVPRALPLERFLGGWKRRAIVIFPASARRN
jgi:hypothetical protein